MWILNTNSSRCKTLPKEHELCGAVTHLLPILSCVIWCFLFRFPQVSLAQSPVFSIYTHQWGWIQTNLTALRIWIDTVSSWALSMLLFTFLTSKLNLNFKLELQAIGFCYFHQMEQLLTTVLRCEIVMEWPHNPFIPFKFLSLTRKFTFLNNFCTFWDSGFAL